MQVVNCLIQIFMGAVSGYYTNKLAISHLFTDIPLPGGNSWKAVIKKGGNKEKLAEDLSEIAEDKILGNHMEMGTKKDSYLYQELSKAEVGKALDRCVEEIFEELEKSSAARRSLKEILEDFRKRDVGQYRLVEQSLLTAAADWTVGDLIGEEAFAAFCEEIKQVYFSGSSSREKNRLDDFMESVLWELSQGEEEITLETVLGEEICERAECVLTEKIWNYALQWRKSDSDRMKMEGYLHSICRQIGVGTIVRNFLILLREKKIGDLISAEGEAWLSENLGSFLERPEIQGHLKRLFEIFMKNLKQADWKLSDLLPEGCLESEKFLEILMNQIKDLQPFVGELYEENQEFISERLKRELGDVIEEGTGNFLQNMVLFSAKDMILEKLEEFLREKMPVNIQEFLEEPSREVCLEICHGIGQISVSELAENVEFNRLCSSVKKALWQEEDRTEASGFFLEKIKGMSLATVIDNDMIDSLSRKSDIFLTEFISEWLRGEEKKGQIESAVHVLMEKLWKKPLREQEAKTLLKTVRKNSLTKKISGWFSRKWKKEELSEEHQNITENLQRDAETEQQAMVHWIYGRISGIALTDLLLPVLRKTPALFETFMEKYGNDLTAGSVISSIPKEPLKKKIRELFMEKAGDCLPVKAIVKKKVLELDEDTLCEMMQKFMGTQLRPLNRIGGVLGAVVGLLVFAVNPSMELSLPMLLCAVISYGLIGIATNVLALRGLFRPYHVKERKWLGRFAEKNGVISNIVMFFYDVFSKIPGVRNLFCLGYIPENRDMIAKKLAEFVAGNFLKPQDLLPEIALRPEMVQKFLKEHGNVIAEKAVETLRKADWNPAVTMIKNGILRGDVQEDFKNRIRNGDVSFLSEKIYPALYAIQDQPLSRYINPEKTAEEMTQILQKWAGESVHGMDYLRNWYEKRLRKKTAEEIFALYFSESREEFLRKGMESVLSYLYDGKLWEQAEHRGLTALSAMEEQKEQRLCSCFGGILEGFLEKHMDVLELLLFRTLKKGCSQYFLRHEDELVDKLDLELQGMINDMADGMPLGGMAASMLGTRQIIAKVFHRALIEPEVQEMPDEEDGYEEARRTLEGFVREKLSDELFDRNEEKLRNKIGEMIKIQTRNLTIGDLEEILFVPPQEQPLTGQERAEKAEQEKQNRKRQWSHQLCIAVSEVWKQGRTPGTGPVNNLLEEFLSVAGACTVEEYIGLLRKDFIAEAVEETLPGEIFHAVQKPLVGQACKDFFRYFLSSYVLSERCGSYLSAVTEDSLAVMLQNNWKRLCSLSCFDVFLSELLTWKHMNFEENQESGFFVLLKEAVDSLKEKESVWKGCGELIGGGMEILLGCFDIKTQNGTDCSNPFGHGNHLYRVMEEMIDSLNEAFRYEKENRATLVSVAETIDFTRIIYLAVTDMTDAQIEDLFQGFAGRYFLSLKLSGALGFVFGVPVAQWVAAAVALGSEFAGEKKHK